MSEIVSMMAKRQALLDLIVSRLSLHCGGWRSSFYLHDKLRRMATRDDRVGISGNPARYVAIRYVREHSHDATDTVYSSATEVGHTFRVHIDYQWQDQDDHYKTSSQSVFDRLTESTDRDDQDDTLLGLLPYLRELEGLEVSGRTTWVIYHYDAEYGEGPLDLPQNSGTGLPDMAHTLTFTITLI